MSDFEIKEEGRIFITLSPNTEGKRPEYFGNANVDGQQKTVSLWVKRDENGEVALDENGRLLGFSGTIQEPYKKPSGGGGQMKPQPKPKSRY